MTSALNNGDVETLFTVNAASLTISSKVNLPSTVGANNNGFTPIQLHPEFSADCARLWIPGYDNNKVIVFKPSTSTVVTTKPVTFSPLRVTFPIDGTRAYVYGTNGMSVVNTTNYTVTSDPANAFPLVFIKYPSLNATAGITASTTTPGAGQPVTLTATSSASVSNTSFNLDVVDATTGIVIKSCSTGTSCLGYLHLPGRGQAALRG